MLLGHVTQELRELVAAGAPHDKGEVLARAVAEVERLRAENEGLITRLSQLSLAASLAPLDPSSKPLDLSLVSASALPMSGEAAALRMAAYDALPVGVLLVRGDRVILDANGTLAGELGYTSAAQLRGRWVHELVQCDGSAKADFAALRAGTKQEAQMCAVLTDAAGRGRAAWMRVTVANHAGTWVLHMVVLFRPKSDIGPCPTEVAARVAEAARRGDAAAVAEAEKAEAKCCLVEQ